MSCSLATFVTKLQENSPLKLQFAGCSLSISPKNMLHVQEASSLKFENIVDNLFSHSQMSSSEADTAKKQYESFLNGTVPKNRENFDRYNSNNNHIDTFLAEFLARNEEFRCFRFVYKIIFTLLHSRIDRARL